jgi:hypothetical protein
MLDTQDLAAYLTPGRLGEGPNVVSGGADEDDRLHGEKCTKFST